MFGVPKCQENTAIKLAYSPPDGSVFGVARARQSPLSWRGKDTAVHRLRLSPFLLTEQCVRMSCNLSYGAMTHAHRTGFARFSVGKRWGNLAIPDGKGLGLTVSGGKIRRK